MEPQGCEGTRGPRYREHGPKRETGVITDPAAALGGRPADDQGCLVPLPAGPVPVREHDRQSRP